MATNVKALIDAIKTADTAGGGRCECDDDVDQLWPGKKETPPLSLGNVVFFNILLVYLMAPAIQKANSLGVGQNE